MTDKTLPAPPPSDLAPRGRGRKFWRQVLAEYDLRVDELELLAECCRQLDLLDDLRTAAAGSPLVVDGRIHPAIVETRQVRQELRRALAQLCLSDLEAEGEGSMPSAANFRSWRARRAARARWSHEPT